MYKRQTLYSAGYHIYTSIDPDVQKQLQSSVDNALSGYTEKDKNGIYKTQASGTCIDNDTGKVVAIVGGREQKNIGYTLNRAFQSPRPVSYTHLDRVVPTKVEIQIRTVVMDFWASLEHKIYYKYEGNTPEYIKKELKECADLVTFLDSKMLAINEEVRSIREENRE